MALLFLLLLIAIVRGEKLRVRGGFEFVVASAETRADVSHTTFHPNMLNKEFAIAKLSDSGVDVYAGGVRYEKDQYVLAVLQTNGDFYYSGGMHYPVRSYHRRSVKTFHHEPTYNMMIVQYFDNTVEYMDLDPDSGISIPDAFARNVAEVAMSRVDFIVRRTDGEVFHYKPDASGPEHETVHERNSGEDVSDIVQVCAGASKSVMAIRSDGRTFVTLYSVGNSHYHAPLTDVKSCISGEVIGVLKNSGESGVFKFADGYVAGPSGVTSMFCTNVVCFGIQGANNNRIVFVGLEQGENPAHVVFDETSVNAAVNGSIVGEPVCNRYSCVVTYGPERRLIHFGWMTQDAAVGGTSIPVYQDVSSFTGVLSVRALTIGAFVIEKSDGSFFYLGDAHDDFTALDATGNVDPSMTFESYTGVIANTFPDFEVDTENGLALVGEACGPVFSECVFDTNTSVKTCPWGDCVGTGTYCDFEVTRICRGRDKLPGEICDADSDQLATGTCPIDHMCLPTLEDADNLHTCDGLEGNIFTRVATGRQRGAACGTFLSDIYLVCAEGLYCSGAVGTCRDPQVDDFREIDVEGCMISSLCVKTCAEGECVDFITSAVGERCGIYETCAHGLVCDKRTHTCQESPDPSSKTMVVVSLLVYVANLVIITR